MNEEFLQKLGIEKSVSDKILSKYNSEKFDTALENELLSAGVCDKSAAEMLLKKDELTLDNLSEKVALLKNEHPVLFKNKTPKIISSAEPAERIEKSNFEKMGYKERLALFKKSPDVYKKLVRQ